LPGAAFVNGLLHSTTLAASIHVSVAVQFGRTRHDCARGRRKRARQGNLFQCRINIFLDLKAGEESRGCPCCGENGGMPSGGGEAGGGEGSVPVAAAGTRQGGELVGFRRPSTRLTLQRQIVQRAGGFRLGRRGCEWPLRLGKPLEGRGGTDRHPRFERRGPGIRADWCETPRMRACSCDSTARSCAACRKYS